MTPGCPTKRTRRGFLIPGAVLLLMLPWPLAAQGFSERTLEVDAEFLGGDGIDLYGSTVAYTATSGPREWSVSLGVNQAEIAYEPGDPINGLPVDPFGLEVDLSETRVVASGTFQAPLGSREFLAWTASTTLYDGFGDFNQIWLNEYYRQQFEDVTLPGASYREPSPWGAVFNAGLRWEYAPTTGILEVTLGYARDRIAPGYEVFIDEETFALELERGVEDLDTGSITVTSENIVHRRVRARHQLYLGVTTDREPRVALQSAWNVAVSETLVARLAFDAAREQPDFEAYAAALTLDWEVTPGWMVGLVGRRYQDTGQIENANLVTTAAPGQQVTQAAFSLRYLSEDESRGFRILAGPYWTDFEPTGVGSDRFNNLYRDRDWTLVQAAASFRF